MAKKKKAAKAAEALSGETALTKQLESQVAADSADNTVLKEDPSLSAEAARIRGELEASRGKIADLDPDTQATRTAE